MGTLNLGLEFLEHLLQGGIEVDLARRSIHMTEAPIFQQVVDQIIHPQGGIVNAAGVILSQWAHLGGAFLRK